MTKPPNEARRSERSRQAILSTALELCASHGIRAVTVEAIAARAGVSKKTIYRWWPSKNAVVLEAIADSASAVAYFPHTGDIVADLHAQVTAVIGLLTPQHTSPLVGLLAESQHDPALARQVREVDQHYIDGFKNRMRLAQQDGQVPPDADLDVAMDLVYGPIFHRLAFHLGMPNPAQLHKLISTAIGAFGPRHS